ncbi:MAG TPA: hypothetical protein VFE31_11830, partial [Opitutaceae bacterium]|nr:hypothetical protein [Opitutaceae bacterium]
MPAEPPEHIPVCGKPGVRMRWSPIFDPVSPQATAMERLSTVAFIVAGIIFAGVTLWIVVSLIRFRASPD